MCLSFYRPRALGPFFPHCAVSTPLGRKTREINYVSCWWGFDVKSWGKRCSVTFSLHLLYVIQRVQPPPKSPSPSCCSVPAFRDISHVIRATHEFDLNLEKKLFFLVLFCFRWESTRSITETQELGLHTCLCMSLVVIHLTYRMQNWSYDPVQYDRVSESSQQKNAYKTAQNTNSETIKLP